MADTRFKPNDPRLIGNQYAKGCTTSGTPRTTSPPKEEVIELGKKLVKWATEESKELRCRFCEWYTLEEIGMIKKEWKALVQLPEFRLYYERARAALGRRYLDGTINPSVGHRVMWHYVPESAEQEKEKIDHQEEARARADIKTGRELNICTTNYANATDPLEGK